MWAILKQIARGGIRTEPAPEDSALLGASVVQLYVGCEESRVLRVKNELKGFGRVQLEPNEAAVLELEIADEDLCYFDADAGDWRLEACVYRLSIGFSSRDLPLTGRWRLADGVWMAR